jgi:uncharacterized protein GlcG (DUF336 family)
MPMRAFFGTFTVLAIIAAAPCWAEESVVTYKSLAPDVAFDLARSALTQCRKDGFQVAVVVVDRFGQQLVLLRDRYVGSMAMTVANKKALTSLNFSRSTSELGRMMQAGELSRDYLTLPNVVPLGGGLVIQSGGSNLGAIGVSGASGGDKDEACAKAGLASIQEKLDF